MDLGIHPLVDLYELAGLTWVLELQVADWHVNIESPLRGTHLFAVHSHSGTQHGTVHA